jgi:hypothetical protein
VIVVNLLLLVSAYPVALQVTVIGKIVNVRDANMTLTLTITDGTGTVDVDHFLNDSDGGQVVSKAAQ